MRRVHKTLRAFFGIGISIVCALALIHAGRALEPKVHATTAVQSPTFTWSDAIYNTTRKDNEKQSAKWARDSVLAAGVSSEQADRIYELVMATVHDAVPVGRDAEVLVDIDLGILGAETTRFDESELQVREEYSWVSESLIDQRAEDFGGVCASGVDLQHRRFPLRIRNPSA